MAITKESKYRYRFTASVDDETAERAKYWAEKKGISINEFLRDAIEFFIAYQNKDYDLPTLETNRLNQLVDTITVLSSNIKNLETIVTTNFESLLTLTTGDSGYLEDDEDTFEG